MKRGLLIILTLTLLVSTIFANDYKLPGPQKKAMKTQMPEKLKALHSTRRDTCSYTFSVLPISVVSSINYYDYMIGGYNSIPLTINPNTYGGYFLTYHGKNTQTGKRRVYFAYISDTGTIENHSFVSTNQHWEGYPSIANDPVSGKPFYAWHYGLTADDTYFKIRFNYDTFFEGETGVMVPPVVIVDNPVTDTVFANPPHIPTDIITTDNEYLWPTVKIGVSPIAGMRRVYVLCRNSTPHVPGVEVPSENVRIVYADFDTDMLDMGTPLVWNYTSIPVLDVWNTETDGTYRRPNNAFTIGNDGKIYYVGFHSSSYAGTDAGIFLESDLDAFVCDNYGEGTWTRIQSTSEYKSYNPRLNYGAGAGFFEDNNEIPIPDDSLFWSIGNCAHMNAEIDDNGSIHMLGIWLQQFNEHTNGVIKQFYHPSLQNVKDLVFNSVTNQFSYREIYPIAGTSTDTLLYKPWDENGDWVTDDYWDADDPDIDPTSYGYPKMSSDWPFPHWNSDIADDAMMFHYSNTKITKPNAQGMMAAIWQDSNRARLYNQENGSTWYPELAPFANTPEIWMSFSPDFGLSWSEPNSLNKVEIPQFANLKPMWVYPAEQVKFDGVEDGHNMGKLAFMFYDDVTWGSYQMDPPEGPNDGGYVKFMELRVKFPLDDNDDHFVTPQVSLLQQNYPNPFNPETTIKFDMPKKGRANLSIYNVKGQLVKTLVNDIVTKGEQKFTWKGTDNNNTPVASGLYFYKLNTGGKVETRKMMLMK